MTHDLVLVFHAGLFPYREIDYESPGELIDRLERVKMLRDLEELHAL